jgi:hypothetical protein
MRLGRLQRRGTLSSFPPRSPAANSAKQLYHFTLSGSEPSLRPTELGHFLGDLCCGMGQTTITYGLMLAGRLATVADQLQMLECHSGKERET